LRGDRAADYAAVPLAGFGPGSACTNRQDRGWESYAPRPYTVNAQRRLEPTGGFGPDSGAARIRPLALG